MILGRNKVIAAILDCPIWLRKLLPKHLQERLHMCWMADIFGLRVTWRHLSGKLSLNDADMQRYDEFSNLGS